MHSDSDSECTLHTGLRVSVMTSSREAWYGRTRLKGTTRTGILLPRRAYLNKKTEFSWFEVTIYSTNRKEIKHNLIYSSGNELTDNFCLTLSDYKSTDLHLHLCLCVVWVWLGHSCVSDRVPVIASVSATAIVGSCARSICQCAFFAHLPSVIWMAAFEKSAKVGFY